MTELDWFDFGFHSYLISSVLPKLTKTYRKQPMLIPSTSNPYLFIDHLSKHGLEGTL